MSNLFIERSLAGALNFFKEAVSYDDIARSKGLLQSLDERIKIILLIASLVLTVLVNNIFLLAGLYLLSICLAVLSKVNVGFFLKRVWFFIPIFTLFIAIPAVFMKGLESAVIFILRVTDCVSFVVLITITTRHTQFLKSLRSLGVPSIFIQVLDMTYRYIFLFVRAFEEMHLSLKSRLVKRFDRGRARYWIASRLGYLFKRSLRMSEDVYLAMIARGYTGDSKKNGK